MIRGHDHYPGGPWQRAVVTITSWHSSVTFECQGAKDGLSPSSPKRPLDPLQVIFLQQPLNSKYQYFLPKERLTTQLHQTLWDAPDCTHTTAQILRPETAHCAVGWKTSYHLSLCLALSHNEEIFPAGTEKAHVLHYLKKTF